MGRAPTLRSQGCGSLTSWPCPLQWHLSSPVGQGHPWSSAASDQNTWGTESLGTSLAVAVGRLGIKTYTWLESLGSSLPRCHVPKLCLCSQLTPAVAGMRLAASHILSPAGARSLKNPQCLEWVWLGAWAFVTSLVPPTGCRSHRALPPLL